MGDVESDSINLLAVFFGLLNALDISVSYFSYACLQNALNMITRSGDSLALLLRVCFCLLAV